MELAIEELDVAIFLGTTRFDKERLDVETFEPPLDYLSTELGTVIRADVLGRTSADEQLGQRLQHLGGAKLSLNSDSQAFPGVFIDHGEHPECPTVAGAIGDEVISPDVILVLGAKLKARAVVEL